MSAERSWDDEVEDNESDSDDEEALSAGAPGALVARWAAECLRGI